MSIVKKQEMNGEIYYLMSNGMWTNSSFTKVSKEEMYKLDRKRFDNLENMSFDDKFKLALSMKEQGNLTGAQKIYDKILEENNDIKIIKIVLPCYTSLLRKLEKPQDAIVFAEEYLAIYGKSVETAALFTSIAGAYCDIGDYFEARKKANIAMCICGGKPSQELINVYRRIKAMEK